MIKGLQDLGMADRTPVSAFKPRGNYTYKDSTCFYVDCSLPSKPTLRCKVYSVIGTYVVLTNGLKFNKLTRKSVGDNSRYLIVGMTKPRLTTEGAKGNAKQYN